MYKSIQERILEQLPTNEPKIDYVEKSTIGYALKVLLQQNKIIKKKGLYIKAL